MAIGDSLRKFFLGERAEEVALPTGLEEARRRREAQAARFEATATGAGPTEGERAARAAGEEAEQELTAALRTQAAGVRGPGALFAQREAQRQAATGRQTIAGTSARAASEARARDKAMAEESLARVLAAQEEEALRRRQLQEQLRSQGFLSSALGVAGGALGMKLGGAEGARAGGGLGYEAGRSLSRAFGGA